MSSSQISLAHTVDGKPDHASDTVIAKGITVLGDLRGAGNVLVEGTVIGGIWLDGAITVEISGTVKGPVQADAVDIAGAVEGDIVSKTYLHLNMTGSITGDVTMRSFTIEDGGYFSGRSHMTSASEEPVILY